MVVSHHYHWSSDLSRGDFWSSAFMSSIDISMSFSWFMAWDQWPKLRGEERRVSFQPRRKSQPPAPSVFLIQLSAFGLWRRWWTSSPTDITSRTAEAQLCSAVPCFCAVQPSWPRSEHGCPPRSHTLPCHSFMDLEHCLGRLSITGVASRLSQQEL